MITMMGFTSLCQMLYTGLCLLQPHWQQLLQSQSLISATFFIIKQSVVLDYFPNAKVVHTSSNKEGEVYSPEVKYILMVLCVAVILVFGVRKDIRNDLGMIRYLTLHPHLFTICFFLTYTNCLPILKKLGLHCMKSSVPLYGELAFALPQRGSLVIKKEKKKAYNQNNHVSIFALMNPTIYSLHSILWVLSFLAVPRLLPIKNT